MSNILRKQPKAYQQDIVNQVISTNASTLIQLPTGSGKTFIAKLIALEFTSKDQRVLFVTPQENLMEQTMEEFKSLRPQKVHGAAKYDPQHLISVSTNQTAKNRKDLKPDVIIVDEIHYGYTGKMLAEIKEANPNSRIIGLSATPYDQDGVLLKGFEIILDDYDVKYMIENGYLVDVETYTAVPRNLFHKLDNIRIVAGDYDKQALGKLMGDPTAVLEVVNATKDHINKSKKTIVFAVNIKHANLLTEAYKKAGFSCEVLHSETKKQNDEIVSRFKKGYVKVLVSVNMLTTGFDVPDTDMAVIARPTKSQNLYKQMVGRIMRLAPDKTHATLLDCGGVVRNLGYPTDAIQERLKSGRAVGKHLCSFCGSQRLHPKNINEKIYWVCSECGGKKEAKEARIYRCESCNTYSGRNANLYMDDKVLTLICLCGYHTVISTPNCDEVLTQVIDPKRKIEIITNRVIREYKELIEKYFGNKELENYHIKNHIQDIKYKIIRDSELFVELDLTKKISSTNKFIDIVKNEQDAFDQNMPIVFDDFIQAIKAERIQLINYLILINQNFRNNPTALTIVLDQLNDTLRKNNENHVRSHKEKIQILHKIIYELYFLQVWQDFFIVLPLETLYAIARLFQILYSIDFAKNNSDFQQPFIEIYKKQLNDLYKNTFKQSINFLQKLSIKTIEKNYDLIDTFDSSIVKSVKLFYSDILEYDDQALDDLFDDDWKTFSTTNEIMERSQRIKELFEAKKTENGKDKKEAIIGLNEYISQQGRFVKNPEIAMQFVALFVNEYDVPDIDHVFSDISTRIERITHDSKIKNEHKILILELNKKIFSFKKFDLWHDSFFYLNYENFEAILGLFTLIGDNLKRSINKYVYDNNEMDAKTLAISMRSELHNTENHAFDVWQQNDPQEKKENLLKNSKQFKQLFNERMTKKIADFEKILS